MTELTKRQEETVLNCYANLPPDEKLPFVEMIEFVAAHPGSHRLLREARMRRLDEPSKIFAYLQDNWVDPEPLQ